VTKSARHTQQVGKLPVRRPSTIIKRKSRVVVAANSVRNVGAGASRAVGSPGSVTSSIGAREGTRIALAAKKEIEGDSRRPWGTEEKKRTGRYGKQTDAGTGGRMQKSKRRTQTWRGGIGRGGVGVMGRLRGFWVTALSEGNRRRIGVMGRNGF